MFDTVVVPIDGSALSNQAVGPAATLADAANAKVRLVAVARDDGELSSMYDHVHAAARLLPPGVEPAVDVVVDPEPVEVLLAIAADESNLLCFTSHDHNRLASELLRSVGSTVMRQAVRPFVVVAVNASPPLPSGDIVAALDGTDNPEPVLSTAAAWAVRFGRRLRLVTVYEPVPADLREPDHYSRHHGPPGEPDQYMDHMRTRVSDARGEIEVVAVPDPVSVAGGLEEHLREHPAFMVVMGSESRRWPSSTVRHLLQASPPPLLIVNHGA
jgi:nucleotide-binding universal stress UspA family protein